MTRTTAPAPPPAGPESDAGIVSRIRALLPELRPAEKRVAEAVVGDPALVARESVSSLAARCRTSAPTVVRFAQHVGFSGFPELKLALATAIGVEQGRASREPLSGTLDSTDSLKDIVEKIGYADARGVEDTVLGLDLGALEAVVTAIASARRVDMIGVGASGLTAEDLHQKLSRIGVASSCSNDRHAAMTLASLRGAGDVTVAVSHSGATSDVIEPLRLARRGGATTVALTNHPGSPLAVAAELVLTTAARETSLRTGAMASRIAQLTVVDCVFVAVAARDLDATMRALDVSFKAVGDL